MANTNFRSQISKSRRIKGFGQNVGQLSLCVYVSHLNVSLLYMISHEVVSPLKVPHSFVEDWFFGYRDGTGVIAHEGNSLKAHSKVSWCAQSIGFGSSSYILSLYGGLGNWRLFLRGPANERRSKKMISPRSAFTINPTTCKIDIRKANKIQWRRSRIANPKLECVFEIPEDLLNCHVMWRAWGSLKARTQAHDKLNVWSCHCEVQEEANHAPVLSLATASPSSSRPSEVAVLIDVTRAWA
jgi:hypothetical protein